MKLKAITAQIQTDILGNSYLHIVAVHILYRDGLFAIMNNQLYQQVLPPPGAYPWGNCSIADCAGWAAATVESFNPAARALCLHLLTHTIAHKIVQGIHDNCLVHAQTVRTVGDIRSAGYLIFLFSRYSLLSN